MSKNDFYLEELVVRLAKHRVPAAKIREWLLRPNKTVKSASKLISKWTGDSAFQVETVIQKRLKENFSRFPSPDEPNPPAFVPLDAPVVVQDGGGMYASVLWRLNLASFMLGFALPSTAVAAALLTFESQAWFEKPVELVAELAVSAQTEISNALCAETIGLQKIHAASQTKVNYVCGPPSDQSVHPNALGGFTATQAPTFPYAIS